MACFFVATPSPSKLDPDRAVGWNGSSTSEKQSDAIFSPTFPFNSDWFFCVFSAEKIPENVRSNEVDASYLSKIG